MSRQHELHNEGENETIFHVIYFLLTALFQDCKKTTADGRESMVDIAYIRGSQIRFIILPDMLQKAPFFNRIKMWRKYRGRAIFGANTAAVNAPVRGQSLAIINKSRERRLQVQGVMPNMGMGAPRPPYPGGPPMGMPRPPFPGGGYGMR